MGEVMGRKRSRERVKAERLRVSPCRRFPFEPLENLVRQRLEAKLGERATATELADEFGVDRQTLLRLRRRGMDEVYADRYAVRVGLHPRLVWPDYHADITA